MKKKPAKALWNLLEIMHVFYRFLGFVFTFHSQIQASLDGYKDPFPEKFWGSTARTFLRFYAALCIKLEHSCKTSMVKLWKLKLSRFGKKNFPHSLPPCDTTIFS